MHKSFIELPKPSMLLLRPCYLCPIRIHAHHCVHYYTLYSCMLECMGSALVVCHTHTHTHTHTVCIIQEQSALHTHTHTHIHTHTHTLYTLFGLEALPYSLMHGQWRSFSMAGIQIYQRPFILHFCEIDALRERESGGERGRERGEAGREKNKAN